MVHYRILERQMAPVVAKTIDNSVDVSTMCMQLKLQQVQLVSIATYLCTVQCMDLMLLHLRLIID